MKPLKLEIEGINSFREKQTLRNLRATIFSAYPAKPAAEKPPF